MALAPCEPLRGQEGEGKGPQAAVTSIAAGEAQRRQQQVEAAQALFTAGAQAFADRSYGEAMDNFKAAFELLPAVPAVEEQRRVFFQRYQAAALRYAINMTHEAMWAEAESTLAEVMETARGGGVPAARLDPDVRKMLGDLRNRDERYNMATTPRHLRNVNEVEHNLALARGYLDLGDYDRAERSYQNVLSIDPHSTAARRGLEQVERHRLNYYDAAANHTRARMLREVAAGWESPVSALDAAEDLATLIPDTAMGRAQTIEAKLRNIIIPSLEFDNARFGEVIEFLSQRAQELDGSEVEPSARGVSIIIDAPGEADPAQRTLSVRLANVPLGEALRYAAQLVGMRYRVDDFAVVVVPMSDEADAVLVTRTFTVPPGFLSGGGAGDAAPGPVDPFAAPEQDRGALVRRVTAQEFLENSGVQFPPGASARFVAASNALIVRNTAAQIELVEGLVHAAREGVERNVHISVKMLSIEEFSLRQAGMDFLLGEFGGSRGVFFGGGTHGNSFPPMEASDFPFLDALGNPVGMHPITAGLRMGSIASNRSIADLIVDPFPIGDGTGGSSRAPGVFSVAGLFTDPQFQVVIRALSQMKGVDLLCDAQVMTQPGQPARIEIVREFIYPTEYDPPEIPNAVGGNLIAITPAMPVAFETRNLGKTIEVEGTVDADNLTVNVNVIADFTEFVGFINYGSPIRAPSLPGGDQQQTANNILMPVFDAIKETTNVNIWDGQTIAIGGFHGESVLSSEDKIPFIGDLPVLGRAFRSTSSSVAKQALLIFVTVRLIDPGGNPVNRPREDEPDLFTESSAPAPARTQLPAGQPAGPPPAPDRLPK